MSGKPPFTQEIWSVLMKDSQNQKKKQRKFIKKQKPQSKPQVVVIKKEKKPLIFPAFGANFSKYLNDILLFFIPIGLFFIFVVLILINNQFLRQIYANQIPT